MIFLIASIDSGIDMLLTALTENMTAVIRHKWNHKHERTLPFTDIAVTFPLIMTAVITAETMGKSRNICTEAQTDEAYREWFFYRSGGMSHTVTSRELVRQVPAQNRQCCRFAL